MPIELVATFFIINIYCFETILNSFLEVSGSQTYYIASAIKLYSFLQPLLSNFLYKYVGIWIGKFVNIKRFKYR